MKKPTLIRYIIGAAILIVVLRICIVSVGARAKSDVKFETNVSEFSYGYQK